MNNDFRFPISPEVAVDLVRLMFPGYKSCCLFAMTKNGMACPVCRTNLMYQTEAKNVRLGDVVSLNPLQPYLTGTVRKINENGTVQIHRPHVVCGSFTYTAGVPVSIGVEDFFVWKNTKVWVLQESSVTEVRIHETDEGRLRRSGSKIAKTPEGGLIEVERYR